VAEEEIAVVVNEMPVDGFDLPPGVTSDEFSLYVAVDADVQTAAEGEAVRWPAGS